MLAKTIHHPFQCQKHILTEGHILFWFGFNIKDSLSTTVPCLIQVKAFSAYPKFRNFILCVSSVYRVTSQPFSLPDLYSMVQNLKCTCISKNTLLQVVFSTLFSVIDLWSNTVSHVWYITLNIFFSKMFSREILVIKTMLWLKNSRTYRKRDSLLKSAYSVTKRYKTRDHQKMLRIMPWCSWVEDVYLSLVGGRFSLLW